MMVQQKGARLLHSCLNMRRQLNRLLSNGDLTQGEYLVLRNLWLSGSDSDPSLPGSRSEGHNKGRHVKAADLSDMLELSRPSITRILNDLEHRGFITRSIDKKDRRSIRIELTQAGAEALEKANRRILGIAERLVVSLGETDTDKLIELMDRLAEIYRELLEERRGESDEQNSE